MKENCRRIIGILEKHIINHPKNDSNIIDYLNKILYGIEFGVVLTSFDDKYEVYIHVKIEDDIYTNINYRIFDNIESAKKYYNKYKDAILTEEFEYIINYIDAEKIRESNED